MMPKTIKTVCIALALSTTAVTAGNVNIGMKIYGTKLKSACGFNGVKFTMSHTPQEWEKIYNEGKLAEEFKRLCPRVTEYKDTWTDHLYAFVYEFGKGSGNEPTCE